MKIRRLLAIVAVAITVGLGIAFASPAHAGTGNQFCTGLASSDECYNAWNAGPDIKSYTIQVVNNDFTIQNTSLCNGGFTTTTCPSGWSGGAGWEIVNIEDTDGGSFDGDFIGDSGNSSTSAKAGLVAPGGWGTNFVWFSPSSGCVAGATLFWDTHWKGLLGTLTPSTNGNQQYLNLGVANCTSTFSAA